MSFKRKSGKVKILPEKTFKELNVDTNKLNLGSHQKVFVRCCSCNEIFLREFRKLYQFHCCPTHITREDGLKLKWCSKCKNFLSYSNFSKNKARIDNMNSYCQACCKTTKSYQKQNQKKINTRKTFDGWLTNYLSNKKNYCKREGIDCNLTKKFLKTMWETQKQRCYYSNVELTFNIRAMNSATLDRIDSIKGYTQDNVVWCSNAMNNMKNNFSLEKLNLFLQNIIFTSVRIEFKKDHLDAKSPFRKRTTDAGYDLASISDIIIPPGKVVNIDTGLRISAPEGWYFTIDGRSSLFKEGIVPFRGIIDSNYTGPLLVSLYNSSDKDFKVNKDDRIAQMIPHKIHDVDFVQVTDFSPEYFVHRGEAGWGSSGRK